MQDHPNATMKSPQEWPILKELAEIRSVDCRLRLFNETQLDLKNDQGDTLKGLLIFIV